MVKVFGNNIKSAFTGGVPVKAIYAQGSIVWSIPTVSSYYIRWSPVDLTGYFNISVNDKYASRTYFQDCNGEYNWSDGVIGSYIFSNRMFTDVETNAVMINNAAFNRCTVLSRFTATDCSYIGSGAFVNCSSLTSFSAPKCTYIGGYAFMNCLSLPEISLPACTCVLGDTFSNCSSLSRASLPACSVIGSWAFCSCSSLEQIYLPVCQSISACAFWNCSSLKSISLPVCSYIADAAFVGCNSLSMVVLESDSVCVLGGSYVFQDMPSPGFIYVPASLVDTYRSATNWVRYRGMIVPIP